MLVLGTLFMLAVAIATLAFWYAMATTGLLDLTEPALYFMRNIGLIGLLVGGIGLFVAIGTFNRAVLPTADLMEAIGRVTAGDYNLELQERGPRELRSLIRSFNQMMEQLRTRRQARLKLTADVSRALQATHSDETRHAHLEQDWYRLALAENGEQPLHPEPTDIGALVSDALTTLHREASSRTVTLRATVPGAPLIAELDPVRLGEIVTCLTLHALSRLEGGGEVIVDVSESRHPNGVRIAVNDNGPTPAPADLRCLLTDFHPGATAGSGLELPLVRTWVEAQGGVISATPAKSGLTIAFLLPFD